MVREVLFNQNVTVKSAHFRNSKYADAAEGLSGNRKYLALCNVCAELAVCGTLQTVEGNVAGHDVTFECTVGNFFGQASCHNHLVLHVAECQLLGAGIAAVEAHEGILMCIRELAFNRLFVHISRNTVVDIKQGNGILADAGTDKLA